MQRYSILCLLSLCTLGLSACPSGSSNPTQQPTPGVSPSPSASSEPPNPQSSASVTPVPNASASPGTPSDGEPTPVPSGQGGADFVLPANVVGIRFDNKNNRFLNQKGGSTTFAVEFIDSNGKAVALNNVSLEWSSSRPQDFSVDANGKLTALVEAGFSTIEVRVKGTQLDARSVINVASGSSGGGGGGGGGNSTSPTPLPNAAPVITSLNASSTSVTGTGTLIKLTALATDADDTLIAGSYNWSCSPNCNTFEGTTGTTVYWRTPATSGNYALKVTVSDGKASVSREEAIAVTTGQGTLLINPPPP